MKRLAKREMKKRKRMFFFKQDGSVETLMFLNFEITFFLFIASSSHMDIQRFALPGWHPTCPYKPTTHLVLTPLKSVFFTEESAMAKRWICLSRCHGYENPARRIIQTYLQVEFFFHLYIHLDSPLLCF